MQFFYKIPTGRSTITSLTYDWHRRTPNPQQNRQRPESGAQPTAILCRSGFYHRYPDSPPSVQQLRSRLPLLGMFALMKEKAENPESDFRLTDALPSIKRPVRFFGLAIFTPVWMPQTASSPTTNYGKFERQVASLNICSFSPLLTRGSYDVPTCSVPSGSFSPRSSHLLIVLEVIRGRLRPLQNIKGHLIDLIVRAYRIAHRFTCE